MPLIEAADHCNRSLLQTREVPTIRKPRSILAPIQYPQLGMNYESTLALDLYGSLGISQS